MAIQRLKPMSEQQATKEGWGIVVAATGLKGPFLKRHGLITCLPNIAGNSGIGTTQSRAVPGRLNPHSGEQVTPG
jgi:hypothetical protein